MAKPPQSPPNTCHFSGMCEWVYACARENKKEGDRQAHVTHTCAHGPVGVPLQGLVLVPETLPWPSLPYTLCLGPSCPFITTPSSGPQNAPRKSSDMWQFLFLEKVPRGTTAKTCPSPQTGLPVACDCSPTSSPPHRRLKAPVGEFPGSFGSREPRRNRHSCPRAWLRRGSTVGAERPCAWRMSAP